ncbi:MAG: hypothetical protein WED04_03670 [Promethearchaeati archaeon SRVP18_Atabeyarchaeia-1]
MVLKNAERSWLLDVLGEVRSYLAEANEVDKIVTDILGSADSMDDFMEKMQNRHRLLRDPLIRTDLRIYLGRLQRQTRTQQV